MQITVQKRREGKKFFFAYSPHFSFGGGGNWTEDDRRTEGIFLPPLPPFPSPLSSFPWGFLGNGAPARLPQVPYYVSITTLQSGHSGGNEGGSM